MKGVLFAFKTTKTKVPRLRHVYQMQSEQRPRSQCHECVEQCVESEALKILKQLEQLFLLNRLAKKHKHNTQTQLDPTRATAITK